MEQKFYKKENPAVIMIVTKITLHTVECYEEGYLAARTYPKELFYQKFSPLLEQE